MNHTPGPWMVIEQQPWGSPAPRHKILSEGGAYIAVVDCEKETLAEDTANAHLIAAAPDLLEALEGLVMFPLGTFQVEAARRAIAKAKGEDTHD